MAAIAMQDGYEKAKEQHQAARGRHDERVHTASPFLPLRVQALAKGSTILLPELREPGKTLTCATRSTWLTWRQGI